MLTIVLNWIPFIYISFIQKEICTEFCEALCNLAIQIKLLLLLVLKLLQQCLGCVSCHFLAQVLLLTPSHNSWPVSLSLQLRWTTEHNATTTSTTMLRWRISITQQCLVLEVLPMRELCHISFTQSGFCSCLSTIKAWLMKCCCDGSKCGLIVKRKENFIHSNFSFLQQNEVCKMWKDLILFWHHCISMNERITVMFVTNSNWLEFYTKQYKCRFPLNV